MELAKTVEAEEFETIQRMVKCLVASGYFQDCQGAAQGITKALIGRDLGIPVAVSLMDIDVIKGRPSLSASLMGAMIKKSGRYNYRPKKGPEEEPNKWHSESAVCLEFFEKMGEQWEWIGESSFTMNDAQKAGLSKNQNYKSYPRNMLFARALSNGAKWFCADVFLGAVYTPEDFSANSNDSLPKAPEMAPSIAVKTVESKPVKKIVKQVVAKRDKPVKEHEIIEAEHTESSSLDIVQQEAEYEKRMMRDESVAHLGSSEEPMPF